MSDKIHGTFEDIVGLESGSIVTFLNPCTCVLLKDAKVPELYFDKVFVDSGMLSAFLSVIRRKKILRMSFDYSSIADEFFTWCSENKFSVVFVGSQSDILQDALKYIGSRHPDLLISEQSRNGFFEDDREIIEYVRALECDVVVCGMGAPRQENFLITLKKNNDKFRLGVSCGGFITQTGMSGDFYHPLVKFTGLRWLQRFFSEQHVFKRTLATYPRFFIFFSRYLRGWM